MLDSVMSASTKDDKNYCCISVVDQAMLLQMLLLAVVDFLVFEVSPN